MKLLMIGVVLLAFAVSAGMVATAWRAERIDRERQEARLRVVEARQLYASLRERFGTSEGQECFLQLQDSAGRIVGYADRRGGDWVPVLHSGGSAQPVYFPPDSIPGDPPLALGQPLRDTP